MTDNRNSSSEKRTLVVYSGPTSLDRTNGKNDIYLTNFDYFLKHGIECDGVINGLSNSISSSEKNIHAQNKQSSNNIRHAIVLTQKVADRYTAPDGLITRKQLECNKAGFHPDDNGNPFITVLIREDKCYDMESVLVAVRSIDVQHQFDHMVYMNCGLAGPKFGPATPVSALPTESIISSWTEVYTSLLSDKVQMVGHTVNTHFHITYSPHIQSFFFAVNTPMIDLWLETGSLYECGMSNKDFDDFLILKSLIWRYEVGISRVILERGYSIASVFMHRGGKIGEPLILNSNSTFGRHLTLKEIESSDLTGEDGLRMMTETSFPDYNDHRKYAILPWETYVFFKVTRLVPQDIQNELHYTNLGSVQLVSNDARMAPARYWRQKAGVSFWNEPWGRCLVVVAVLCGWRWRVALLKCLKRKLSVHRFRELRRKWN